MINLRTLLKRPLDQILWKTSWRFVGSFGCSITGFVPNGASLASEVEEVGHWNGGEKLTSLELGVLGLVKNCLKENGEGGRGVVGR